jgi:hypothetical protein
VYRLGCGAELPTDPRDPAQPRRFFLASFVDACGETVRKGSEALQRSPAGRPNGQTSLPIWISVEWPNSPLERCSNPFSLCFGRRVLGRSYAREWIGMSYENEMWPVTTY